MKIFKKVISIIFTVLIISWLSIGVYDFLKCGQKNKNGDVQKPLIVLSEKVHNYDDGNVTEYISLGYKYIEYNRISLSAYEFAPFWGDIKEP